MGCGKRSLILKNNLPPNRAFPARFSFVLREVDRIELQIGVAHSSSGPATPVLLVTFATLYFRMNMIRYGESAAADESGRIDSDGRSAVRRQ
jgi:hypothetical protein